MELLCLEGISEALPMLLEPEAWTYIRPGQGKTEAQHRDFLLLKVKEIDSGTGYYWLVKESSTHDLIAGINVTPIPATWEMQIGWMVRKKHQRRGYAFEAAALAMDFVLNQTNIEYLYAVYDSENIASEKIIERLGFHLHTSFEEEDRTILKYRYHCRLER